MEWPPPVEGAHESEESGEDYADDEKGEPAPTYFCTKSFQRWRVVGKCPEWIPSVNVAVHIIRPMSVGQPEMYGR